MNEQTSNTSEHILENPLTLKIFIYIKTSKSDDVGVREIMRATKMGSSSTVSRHLEYLDEAGLIHKLSSNRYTLTSEGMSLKNLQVPVKLSTNLVRKSLITSTSYQISFLLIMFISSFIAIWFDLLFASIIGSVGLIIGLFLGLKHWLAIRKQMSAYSDFEDT